MSESHDATRSLAELGISKSESSRWQRLADVAADIRRAYVEEAKTGSQDITINGLLRFAGAKRDETTAEEPSPRPGYPTAEEIRASSREIYRDVVKATELPRYDAWMVAHALNGGERRQLDPAIEALSAWLAELRRALSSYENVREGSRRP